MCFFCCRRADAAALAEAQHAAQQLGLSQQELKAAGLRCSSSWLVVGLAAGLAVKDALGMYCVNGFHSCYQALAYCWVPKVK
jgi:hypothetical protein